jgi:hypothetical protein
MVLDLAHGRGVQVGNHNIQLNTFQLPRHEVSWPHQVGVVPPAADCRQHRPADAYLAALAAKRGEEVRGCQVLSGLGGVGKTQLAAGLAQRAWDQGLVDLLVWVTAASRVAVLSRYAQAAADITGIEDADPQRAADRFLAWLAEPNQRRWMVVLDDVQDPAHLHGLWPPTSRSGQAVVTTRRRDAALLSGRQLIEVGVFTPDQSSAYLGAKLGGRNGGSDQAALLAGDLGHLPLALAQSAAYMLDRGLDCAGYRRRLADRRRTLADLVPESLPDQHHATIAATWSLSIDAADNLAPTGLALPVLEVAALLDPNVIPVGVFTAPSMLAYVAARRKARSPTPTVDAEDVRDALHGLRRLNLLTLDESDQNQAGNGIGVHALVQRAVREATAAQHVDGLAKVAADALVDIWPEIERDPVFGQHLRANTAALHANAGPHLWDRDAGAHRVLLTAGNSLGNAGLVAAAADYHGELHATAAQFLGPDHRDTLTIRGNLAWWRGQAGDPAAAAAAAEALLADRERVLGADHPDTLANRADLAYWRGHAGDPAAAAAATEALLADLERVLGPDHPEVLTTRTNLADWRGHAGDPAGTAADTEALLADMMRLLGPDHPDTLATRATLARWRGQAGDPAGAAAAAETLLADTVRVLGPDHPITLTTRHNLARARGNAGDPAGALRATEALLVDVVRVLGPDHPDTLAVQHNVAWWQGHAGDPAGAVLATEAALADRERVLGPDHPHTLTTRHNLANWRGRAGDVAGAVAGTEAVLADRLRVLGPDHPHTLATRHSLAHWRGRAGDVAGAVAGTEAVLADRLRVLGPDHLHTLTSRQSLANWRGRAGDVAGAVAGTEAVLADRLRVLGPDHPHTLASRRYLATWRAGSEPRNEG